MYCPLHRIPILYGADDGVCATCQRLNLTVIECELDKIDRTQTTMFEQGYEQDFRQSHAVLVFTRNPT